MDDPSEMGMSPEYGDESEANIQRQAALDRGLTVGDVYQSNGEWGFNVIDGEQSYAAFNKSFTDYYSTAQENTSAATYNTVGLNVVSNSSSLYNNFNNAMNTLFGTSGVSGAQQQHQGDNWWILGNGNPSGSPIQGDKPDPNGMNSTIDLGEFVLPSAGLPININPIKGLGGFNNNVNRVVEDVRGLRKATAVDSVCNTCSKKPHGLPYRRIDSNGNVIDTIKYK